MINEKAIHDKLLAVRRRISGKRSRYDLQSAPALAGDILLNLAFAAKDGKLTQEQYAHFDAVSRAELGCEVLTEARDALTQNRERYGIDTSKRWWRRRDPDREKELCVFRLTRAQLSDRYAVSDWHSEYRPYGLGVSDVLYGRFLRENGLTNQKGSEVTEEDLPSLRSIAESDQPDFLKRRELFQRERLNLRKIF